MKPKYILIVLALTLGFIIPAFSDNCSIKKSETHLISLSY